MSSTAWVTGFDSIYYNYVFRFALPSWQCLPGDQYFYVDQIINDLRDDARVVTADWDRTLCPDYLSGKEVKFWLKSRSQVQALRHTLGKYHYCVWLDADVRVLKDPRDADIWPGPTDLFSVNEKTIKDAPSREDKLKNPKLVDLGIDTGFVAWNLHHPQIEKFIEDYAAFWDNDIMPTMLRKYDTYALKHIVVTENYAYRNLWHGVCTKGKHYCGFEDSDLEQYFYHHWGQRNKRNINGLDARNI